MVDYQLSDAEQTFIIHGIQSDVREDGRACEDYRHVDIMTGVVSSAAGSAHLRLVGTDILVGVKAEIYTPGPSQPDCGSLKFFVDCSANASPLFEGRGGDVLAEEIANFLGKAYADNRSLDMNCLCVMPGQHCWCLYVDVIVLEFGGNVFDAVSLAVKAALYNTRIPVVKVIEDGGLTELDISDDPYDVVRLDVSTAPVIVTMCKISHRHIVDATMKEEACCIARLMMALTSTGSVLFVKTQGRGSLQPDSVLEMLQTGKTVGQSLNMKLMNALKKEEKDENNEEMCSMFLL